MDKQSIGDLVWLSAVSVDMVGSTKIEKADKEKGGRCKELFRITAERTFERFGAERIEWHGEGTVFFFRETDEAIKASIEFITEVRARGLREVGAKIATRVSIGSGLVKPKKELGTMDAEFISLCGHLNSVAPEDSILITEDTYDSLSDYQREKFAIFGTTNRDKAIAFIWPKEEAKEKEHDPAFGIREYLATIKGQCQTLLFSGIPQSSKIPLLELTESFFPLKVKRKGRMIDFKVEERLWLSDSWAELETKPIPFAIEYTESQPLPFDEIFRKENHIILLGDPGSGKTTLLRWLALIYSQGLKAIIDKGIGDARLIPFLIPVSNLYLEREREVNIHPAEAIQRCIKTLGVHIDLDYLKERLKKGQCLILLDGLDEILEKKDRINTARYIEGFIRAFEKNRFIITSRIIGYEEIKVSGDEYILAELEDEEIKRFSHNWFLAFERSVQGKTKLAEIEAEKAKESIVKAIKESDAIRRLAKNPFLLTHICIIQVQGQTLPKYRVDLYRLMCETLFSTWVEARSKALGGVLLATPIDYREGEKVLAPLALWMHEEMQGGLVEGDTIKSKIAGIMKDRGIPAEEAWKSTEEFFKYLANQTQLIVDRGGDRWGFRHRTFEEFLTAKGLIMNEDYEGYLKKYSHNPQWEEVFLLLAGWIGMIDGREKEVTRIVERLADSQKDLEDILHKDLLLAGKIIAENVGVKRDLAESVMERVIDLALRSEYDTLMNEATKVLKKGKELSVGRLLEILGNKDKVESKLRRRAVETLGEIGAKESIPIFTSILKDRKYWKGVRTLAASALGKIDGKASIPILTSILKDKGEDRGVRSRAASALGNIGEKESIPILTSILKDKGENGWVRNGAVFALSEIGGKASIPILTSILKDKGEDREVRVEAASALGRIGEKASIPILTSILKDKGEDREVRAWAASALGKIGGKASIPILTSILKDKGENGWVRNGAAFALGKIGEKESIPILTAILTDKGEDGGVRGEAAIALSNIGEADEEIIHILIEIISKREKDLWILTISSATKLGLRINDMQKTIIEGLNNPSLNSTDKNRLFSVLWRLYS